MIGIYKITNLINNKSYIGQSINIEGRFVSHKKNKRSSLELQKDIISYGIENFSFDIIEECKLEELNEKETFWINYYDSYNFGYNKTKGGKGSVGFKHSEKSKELIKKNHAKHITRTKEGELSFRLKMSKIMSKEGNPMYKKDPWNKGKKMSKEYKEKLSKVISERLKGEGNPCFGKKAINNGNISKYVNKDDIDYYLNNGWKLGYVKRNKAN